MSEIMTVELDLGRDVFQLHGADAYGDDTAFQFGPLQGCTTYVTDHVRERFR
jgi:hypothetical protein